MKLLKTLFMYLPLLVGFALLTSCGDDDEDPQPPVELTIAQLASETDDLSSLTAALERADLFSTLNGNATYTVFAPTNAAFSAFLSANNFSSLDEVPNDLLTDVLLNHVISDELRSANINAGYQTTLSTAGAGGNNTSVYISTDSGVTINGNSTVTSADVSASNGVVHIVNAVISPANVVDFAVTDPTFNILEAALTRSDLNTDLVAALSGEGPFTVFAPTDDAFAGLLMELGANGLDDIDAETLEQVLTYHVIAGANVRSSDLSAGEGPATLQGETFTFDLEGGAKIVDAADRTINIIATDVQGTNGIIHAVDRVLLPSTAVEEMEPSIVDIASGDDNFSSLVAALSRADLVSTLEGMGPFTVFAPTNDAFSAFLSAAGFGSLDEVPTDVLTQVLLNHVVSGNVRSTDLSTGYVSTLATGPNNNNISMYVDLSNGVRLNDVSSVTTADLGARNGVIHVVDAVIGVPSIVTHAVANPTFNILQAALTRGDLSTDLVAALSGEGPFTVFAPTDDAFGQLLMDLGASGLNDIPASTLETVLKYHVIAGAAVAAGDLSNGQVASTFQGEDLTISLENGAQIIDGSGTATNIILTDVFGSNGVVHAIDRVLIPEVVFDAINPSIVDFAVANPDYSILVQAVVRAGLAETLDQTNDLTVFAPNNAAFTQFLADKGFASLDDVPVAVLTEILLNHVVAGVARSTDLSTGYINTLANSPEQDGNISMYVDISNGVRLNGQSSVAAADIDVRNGVIHAVDAVIDLPTVVTFATTNPAFTTLVQALTRSDLPTDFVAALTSEGPFTVFAPTNDAFGMLLEELQIGGLNDIGAATLDAVLKYHVVGGANVRDTEIMDDMSVNTLAGIEFSISTDNGVVITDNRGRSANIVATNVQAANGVIHVLDVVLLP